MFRYELDTGARHLGKLPDTSVSSGTISIPAPDTSFFGKFGTPCQIYPGYRYTLDHNTGGSTGVVFPCADRVWGTGGKPVSAVSPQAEFPCLLCRTVFSRTVLKVGTPLCSNSFRQSSRAWRRATRMILIRLRYQDNCQHADNTSTYATIDLRSRHGTNPRSTRFVSRQGQ